MKLKKLKAMENKNFTFILGARHQGKDIFNKFSRIINELQEKNNKLTELLTTREIALLFACDDIKELKEEYHNNIYISPKRSDLYFYYIKKAEEKIKND